MKKAYLFFENQIGNYRRFPSYISKYLYGDKYFIFNIGEKKDTGIKNKRFNNIIRFNGKHQNLSDEFGQYDELTIILMSFRPIDLLFLKTLKNIFPNKKVRGISIQHGVYSDKLERKSIFIFLKSTYQRVISYLITFYRTDFINGLSKIFFLKEIISVYYSQKKKFSESIILNKYLSLPEKVLIFDESWEKYFNENFYGTKPPVYEKILPRDFELIKSAVYKNSSVLIVSQSLTEDGRYSEQEFKREINIILECIPDDYKIYIKRHPRNDKSLFEKLIKKVSVTDDFIISDYVISGYSSLMQPYFYIGCNVFRWKFNNHYNPSIFDKLSDKNGREEELKQFFFLPKKKLNLQKYSQINIDESYANLIEKY